jgi:hypothetical protein
MALNLRPLSYGLGAEVCDIDVKICRRKAPIPAGSSPTEFSAFIRGEMNRYANVVRVTGVAAE